MVKKFGKTSDKGITITSDKGIAKGTAITSYRRTAIKFQISRGVTNSEISKTLEVYRSLVQYYRKKLEKLK